MIYLIYLSYTSCICFDGKQFHLKVGGELFQRDGSAVALVDGLKRFAKPLQVHRRHVVRANLGQNNANKDTADKNNNHALTLDYKHAVPSVCNVWIDYEFRIQLYCARKFASATAGPQRLPLHTTLLPSPLGHAGGGINNRSAAADPHNRFPF